MFKNRKTVPAVLFAAPKSGSGKTLITCGFLQALKNRGIRPCSFKCGPDYIDPMFHRRVLGIPGANLDSFFLEGDALKRHFTWIVTQSGGEVAVIEGVMGYYDGIGGAGPRASSYDISRITGAPVILIVDQKGSSLSAAALVKGFAEFKKDSRISGVILNRASASLYNRLAPVIEAETGIPVVGFLPESPDYRFESRHLGLFMPDEISELQGRLSRLAGEMEQTVDMDRILTIAGYRQAGADLCDSLIPDKDTAQRGVQMTGMNFRTYSRLRESISGSGTGPPSQETAAWEERKKSEKAGCGASLSLIKGPVIGVAWDEAFCFYYRENLELLEKQGANLVLFSPLRDEAPPTEAQGLLLGGGYPENYAKELSENTSMRMSIRGLWEQKIPLLAECGGFLYLHRKLKGADGQCYPMAGVFDGDAENAGKLGRFGYVRLTAPDGGQIRGHEFHYWDSGCPGGDWLAEKPDSTLKWRCIHQDEGRVCGFPHLYYPSAPSFTGRWLLRCMEWKAKGGRESS